MIKPFAKLFETEEHGQILIKADEGEDGPEMRIFFRPEGLGVCSMAVNYDDTDDGWESMDQAFERQTAESASEMVAGIKAKFKL